MRASRFSSFSRVQGLKGMAVTQPGSGAALDQQDSRVTQLSCSGGMLWAGALMGSGFKGFYVL